MLKSFWKDGVIAYLLPEFQVHFPLVGLRLFCASLRLLLSSQSSTLRCQS